MDLLVPDLSLMMILVIALAGFLLWAWAILSIIRNEFYGENEKLIWALLVIFVPFLGTLLYFTVGIKRIKPQ